MIRSALLFSGALLACVITTPITAPVAQAQTNPDCASQATTQQRRSAGILGALTEGAIDYGMRRAGVSGDYQFRNNVRAFLTDAIACSLTRDEAEQASNATNRALTSGVGANETWESGSRRGVRGSSRVTSERRRNGRTCREVTNVAIVDGQEETVTQEYCMAENGGWERQNA